MTFSIKRFSLTLLLVLLTAVSGYSATDSDKSGAYDWTRVIEAIIVVESEGNARAVSGQSVGAMQITPILVRECNDILSRRGEKKRYTLADRYSVEKSKEMFVLIQSHFNPRHNEERAIRLWNGGGHYTVRGTNGYYRRVLAAMKR